MYVEYWAVLESAENSKKAVGIPMDQNILPCHLKDKSDLYNTCIIEHRYESDPLLLI